MIIILRMRITREWGRDEPGPLQPLGGVVEVGVRLLRVPSHVVFPAEPESKHGSKRNMKNNNFLPLCAMWTAELSVSSVDNTETHFLLIESTMNIILMRNFVG